LVLFSVPLGAQAEDSLRITGSEYYFSDNLICDGDERDSSLSGEWNGHHWTFVAPEATDGSESWQKHHRAELHLQPLETLRGVIGKDRGLSESAAKLSAEPTDSSDGTARLRLISVEPWIVPQEFSATDVYASVVVRLCVRRKGGWESVRYISSRAVKGGTEFWRSDPPAVRQRDFARALGIALESTLSWASRSVEGPWIPGTIEKDPVCGRQLH